jgi:inosine-uridine nucleoside N-ribohydrolase
MSREVSSVTRRRRMSVLLLAATLLAGCASAAPTDAPLDTSPPSAPSDTAAPSPVGPAPVVLDVDMSSDDAMAIPFLVREPSLDVRAVNVVGTGLVHCAQGIQFATDILAALGRRDVPVSCGGETPLGPGHEFPAEWRARADAEYGLSIPRKPASIPDMTPTERMQAVAAAAGRLITVIATGPMTNLAEAFAADPSLPAKIGRIVTMAGAVDVPGNVDLGSGPLPAEWNVYADPTAWSQVLRSGVPITMVSLDATKDAPVNVAFLAELEQDHAAAPADIVYELLVRGALSPAYGDQFWDPLAAVMAVDESVGTIETIPLKVVTAEGPESGRTIRADDGLPVRVATAADQSRFEERFLQGLRLGAPRDTPFSVEGTMSVRFDGVTCADERPEPVMPGDWRIEAESTVEGTAVPVLVRFHEGYGWDDLVEYTRTAADSTAQPPFVEVPWGTVFETPGTSVNIVSLTAGTYAFACLALEPPDPHAVPADGAFTIAP